LWCNLILAATDTAGMATEKLVNISIGSVAVILAVLLDLGIFTLARKQRIGLSAGWFAGVTSNVLIGLAAWYVSPALVYVVGLGGPTFSFSGALLTYAAVSLLAFAILNVVYWVARKILPKSEMSAAMVFSIFWGIAAGGAILLSIFAVYAKDENKQARAFLACILGALLGWLLAMYITPQDSSERTQFAKIGTAVAGLASGYTIKSVQVWAFGDGKQYLMYLVLAIIYRHNDRNNL
jgi:hypothetical protein